MPYYYRACNSYIIDTKFVVFYDDIHMCGKFQVSIVLELQCLDKKVTSFKQGICSSGNLLLYVYLFLNYFCCGKNV